MPGSGEDVPPSARQPRAVCELECMLGSECADDERHDEDGGDQSASPQRATH
jgi:hypothetical protein